MTQTNVNTSVVRKIRRVPRLSASTNPGTPGQRRAAFAKKLIPTINSTADNFPSEKYEWFFEDENGQWIKYGQANTSRDMDCITNVSSDDIEGEYGKEPTKCMVIDSSKHKYLLDFVKMTQTNEETRVERPICRKMKNPPTVQQNLNVEWTVNAAYEWFFKDENGCWVKYGETSQNVGPEHATNKTSNDIENQFTQNPKVALNINSGKNRYTLDFAKMTQTNVHSKVTRDICRRAKILSVSGGATPATINIGVTSTLSHDTLPKSWSPMNTISSKIRVASSSNEYNQYIPLIQKTLPAITIRKMYRIQNPYLWKAYLNKKEFMRQKNPGVQFREEHLFHGTDAANINSICEDNVDWRLHGTRNGQGYGRGSYFSNR